MKNVMLLAARAARALYLAGIFGLAIFSALPAQAREEAFSGASPKYVFLFIGDGMALPQRGAAEFYLSAQAGTDKPGIVKLAMNGFPVQGINTTYSLNSIITDSGAAGTALACGVKTYNGAIGVDNSRQAVKNVAEMAKDKGRKIGIVSSVSLDHATPAAFYAHQVTRNNYYEIALDLAASGYDYFAGGGFKDPEGKKSKAQGEKPNALEVMKSKGYKILQSKDEIQKAKPEDGKLVAINPVLDADKALPYAMDASPAELSLAEFTQKGIDLLDNSKGFFMMVEGGKIDWACHANDAVAAIGDTVAFDKAVAVAVDFAAKHPNETLILVTGDHETGGLTLGFAGTRYGNYYEYLKNQKVSFLKFTALIKEYKKNHTQENSKFEDVIPLIKDSFGLMVPTAAELEEMKKLTKPNEDVTSPHNPYGMYFKEFELTQVRQAFERSQAGENVKFEDNADYLSYGDYDPLTVTLTHILDNKAGLAWTTYSHTGMPVATSAAGQGEGLFAGYYDNTDIAKKLMNVLGAELKTASN